MKSVKLAVCLLTLSLLVAGYAKHLHHVRVSHL
jgi:hypothetical protein